VAYNKLPPNLFQSTNTANKILMKTTLQIVTVTVFALLRDDYECGEIPGAPLRALDVTGQDLL